MIDFFRRLALLFIGCFMLAGVSSAQEFKVLLVNGDILVHPDNEVLIEGASLAGETKIIFGNPEAMAILLDQDKRRYLISASSVDDIKNSYRLLTIAREVRPASELESLPDTDGFDQIYQFFQDSIAWVNDTLAFKISDKIMQSDQDIGFFVKYRLGEDIINKRIPQDSGNLLFVKSDYFSRDGSPILNDQTSEHRLFYFNEEESGTYITDLKLNPVSRKELQILYRNLDKMDREEKITAIHDIVSDLYGRCSRLEIKKAIDK